MNYAIRPAIPGDEAELARLSAQLGYPFDPAGAARRVPPADGAGSALFVAQGEEGKLAGWIYATRVDWFFVDSFVEIAGLVVDEAARGGGVGGALLSRAEAWAREIGLAMIRLRSNAKRAPAHRFYEAHGYENYKTSYNFRKALQ
jgi:GNAT superfamily N-acetyltransferase